MNIARTLHTKYYSGDLAYTSPEHYAIAGMLCMINEECPTYRKILSIIDNVWWLLCVSISK